MDPLLNWLHRPDRDIYLIMVYQGQIAHHVVLPPIALFYTELDALYYMKHIFAGGQWPGKRYKIHATDEQRIQQWGQEVPADKMPWMMSYKIVTKWMTEESADLVYYLLQGKMSSRHMERLPKAEEGDK